VPPRRDRDEPSLRSWWLGARLRERREERGMTLKYVAAYLGVGFTELAAVERGQRVFRFAEVATLLDLYGVVDQVERDYVLGLAASVFRLPRWQDDFGGPELDVSMLDYLWLESAAERIRCYSPVLVPELLRTAEYVEAVVRHDVQGVSDTGLDWWLRTYQDRWQALDRDPGPAVWAVVAESVLRRPVGGSANVLAGQLQHLAEATNDDRVQMRVVRPESGYVPGMDGWFTVFDLPDPYPRHVACTGLGDTVAIHEGRPADRFAGVFGRLWDAGLTRSGWMPLVDPALAGDSIR